MALASCKLDELLCLLPQEVHQKTVEIFNAIPGSLLKFIDPKLITKKVERSEYQLMNEKLIEIDYSEYWNNVIQYSNYVDIQKYSIKPIDETKKGSQATFDNCLFDMGHKTKIDYDKDWNNLRIHLGDSIRKMFDDRQIIEVNPLTLADEIATKCLEQCPEWAKQRKNSSTIIQFHKTFIFRG
ncbi:unnamed protein product, partial [Rotaria sp. Silwood1]